MHAGVRGKKRCMFCAPVCFCMEHVGPPVSGFKSQFKIARHKKGMWFLELTKLPMKSMVY
jgi:hypothetical protein